MKFKNAEIGDRVYDIIKGEWGKIIDIKSKDDFSIQVRFKDGYTSWYTIDGKCFYGDNNPTLFWNKVNLPTDEEDKPPFNLKKFISKNLEPVPYDNRNYEEIFTIFYDGVHHEHHIQTSMAYIPRALYFKSKNGMTQEDILLTIIHNAVSWKQLDDVYNQLGWI